MADNDHQEKEMVFPLSASEEQSKKPQGEQHQPGGFEKRASQAEPEVRTLVGTAHGGAKEDEVL